jgi:hypothetical protein
MPYSRPESMRPYPANSAPAKPSSAEPTPANQPGLPSRLLLTAAVLLLLPATSAFARSSNDHVGFGQDISVSAGDTAGDVVCAFCSVNIHGDVQGDVAVLMGTVTVDSGRNISGDVAILGGDLNLGEESSVGRDVAIAAGNLNMPPSATVRGQRNVLSGHLWLLVPFAPLLIIAGIIWLIVSLVRRNRYQFPAYPNGRGF